MNVAFVTVLIAILCAAYVYQRNKGQTYMIEFFSLTRTYVKVFVNQFSALVLVISVFIIRSKLKSLA